MASPGQKWGACGHLMAGFDKHANCARCIDKSKGSDPCVNNEDCLHCNLMTSEQQLQLSTPHQKKKENVSRKVTSLTSPSDLRKT